MYSQGEEEKYILEFFGDYVGRLLDVGAYHPTILSNSARLIELGWGGVLVEASPKCFGTLNDYYLDNDKIKCYNKALGKENGLLMFYDSAGGVATAYTPHYELWKDAQKDYEKTEVPCITWKEFYEEFPGVYDFISIDIEAMDYSLLRQIDLNETRTKLICVEWNYAGEMIERYLKDFNFEIIFRNSENILAGRKI